MLVPRQWTLWDGDASDMLRCLGRVVQVDSIRTRVESVYVLALETETCWSAFKYCFQIQLAPLHLGELARSTAATTAAAAATTTFDGGAHSAGTHIFSHDGSEL